MSVETSTQIKAIITDIEGTTSSISFVKDVLFPYAAKHLPDYVRNNQAELTDLILEANTLANLPAQADIEQTISQLLQWIADDVKATPLKTLQGKIWQAGYQQGDYQAHVYEDAHQILNQWQLQGLPLYIYSSGSIQAQKLFFEYSQFGNMLPLFQGHFDTTIGNKKETASYTAICRVIEQPPEHCLFLSDSIDEIKAADNAGLQTCWVVREQDSPYYGEFSTLTQRYASVNSFHQIKL